MMPKKWALDTIEYQGRKGIPAAPRPFIRLLEKAWNDGLLDKEFIKEFEFPAITKETALPSKSEVIRNFKGFFFSESPHRPSSSWFGYIDTDNLPSCFYCELGPDIQRFYTWSKESNNCPIEIGGHRWSKDYSAIDITSLIMGYQQKFMNWRENPFEVKQ